MLPDICANIVTFIINKYIYMHKFIHIDAYTHMMYSIHIEKNGRYKCVLCTFICES